MGLVQNALASGLDRKVPPTRNHAAIKGDTEGPFGGPVCATMLLCCGAARVLFEKR